MIGANGSGKTNLLSFFDLLQSILDGGLQYYVAKQGGADVLLSFGSKTTDQIKVDLLLGSGRYRFCLAYSNDERLFFEHESFLKQDGTLYDGGSDHFESRLLDTIRSYEDRDQEVHPQKSCWKVYHFHDTSSAAPVKKNHGLNDNIELASDGRNLAAFLYRLLKTEKHHYDQIVEAVKLVAPFFDDFVLRPTPLDAEKIRLGGLADGL